MKVKTLLELWRASREMDGESGDVLKGFLTEMYGKIVIPKREYPYVVVLPQSAQEKYLVFHERAEAWLRYTIVEWPVGYKPRKFRVIELIDGQVSEGIRQPAVGDFVIIKEFTPLKAVVLAREVFGRYKAWFFMKQLRLCR